MVTKFNEKIAQSLPLWPATMGSGLGDGEEPRVVDVGEMEYR